MTRSHVALCLSALTLLAACSLALDPNRYRGEEPTDAGPPAEDAGPPGDVDAGNVDAGNVDAGNVDAGNVDAGARDAGPPECTMASQCSGNAAECVDGDCVDCDSDGDGHFAPGAGCATRRDGALPDCDDTRGDVHPGAPPICGDGVVNNCDPIPADVGSTLGVQEVGVLDVEPMYTTEIGGSLELPTIVALQSAGGETNAAVAVRVRTAAGSFEAWLFQFDHTAIAPVAPIVATPTSNDYHFVSGFHIWQTGPTAATMVVNGAVNVVPMGNFSYPFFGSFGLGGVTTADVDSVDPDRGNCDFRDIVRDSWSARNNTYIFIGRNTARTVHSLHAVGPGGAIACAANLESLGIDVGDFPRITAAGDIALIQTDSGETYVWKLSQNPPQLYTPGITGEPPMVTFGPYEYLVAQQGGGGNARMSHFDCNQSGGCLELNNGLVSKRASYFPAMARWGSGAAMIGSYDNLPVGGGQVATGVEVRLVSDTGTAVGGDYTLSPYEVIHAPASPPTSSVMWLEGTAIPRVAGSDERDFLVALVMRASDDTMGLDIARVRGCTEP